MVDNFSLIKSLLSFNDSNDFYFLQILKRKKDNPNLNKSEKIVKDYFINSLNYLDEKTEEIKELCTAENARAYIRLNKRNYNGLGLHMINKITNVIQNNNEKSLPYLFSSIAGEYHSDNDKKWLLDIDEDFNPSDYGHVKEKIYNLQKNCNREPLMIEIPTKNGLHLITRPFRKDQFSKFQEQTFGSQKIVIHKDNPTILYCL